MSLGHLVTVIVFRLCESRIWSVNKAIEIKTAHHFLLLQKSYHTVLITFCNIWQGLQTAGDTGGIVGTASNSYKPPLLVVWIVVAGDHCTVDKRNWVGIILGTDSISNK